MTDFNKLVRDKIPEIIIASGETPVTHVIEDDGEFLDALIDKVGEEAQELKESKGLEELADLQEVVNALTTLCGFTPEQVEIVRAKKAQERGGFVGRVFLERTK